MKKKFKEAFDLTKKELTTFMQWRKEEWYIWIFKLCILVAICYVSYLFFTNLDVILALLMIPFVIFLIKIEKSNAIVPVDYSSQLVEVLTKTLQVNHKLFNVISPEYTCELVPTNCPNIQTKYGFNSYHFTIQKSSTNESAIPMQYKEMLHRMIIQQQNILGIFFPFYILDISNDIYHPNCLGIDIVLMTDDKTKQLVSNLTAQRKKSKNQRKSPATKDKDF